MYYIYNVLLFICIYHYWHVVKFHSVPKQIEPYKKRKKLCDICLTEERSVSYTLLHLLNSYQLYLPSSQAEIYSM